MDALTRAGASAARMVLAAMLAIAVAGCASGGAAPDEAKRTAGSVARPPAVEEADSRPAATVSPAASLLAEARSLESRGALDQAGSLLERAVRLDPGSAEAWLSLARLRDADGDPRGARDFALRALSVAGDEPDTARAARRFLDRLQ